MSTLRPRKSILEIGDQRVELDAPGLKVIRRKLERNVYWAVDEAEEFKGYKPRTVRIHVDLNARTPEGVHATASTIEEICAREQQALLSWADGNLHDRKRLAARFDGTLRSVIELYRSDPESGFQDLKGNTQENYEDWLRIVEETIGSRRVDCISPKWFRTCYRRWREPAQKGGPERVRRAYGCIQMVKVVLDLGVQSDLPHCQRLRVGMEKIRFGKNAPREETMSYDQAKAIVDFCLSKKNVAMALSQATHWDTMLRQKDVIGQWRSETDDYVLKPGEIRKGGLVWSGLTLDMIAPGKTLVVRTSKTSQPVVHLIDECQLIMRCLPFIDRSVPNAPVAQSSRGTPWHDHRAFGKAWRRYAKEAGIPPAVWNMDTRASGITEATAGGANDDDLASSAGHGSKATTRRVYKRKAPAISKRVQESRRAARQSIE
ncbi:MAG: hypothetical protein GC182_05480 [Rhodopseudomonas sp.]|nr:hypothetical protein [Rhodopseudomonas sp.]